jgi:hypothetical protein
MATDYSTYLGCNVNAGPLVFKAGVSNCLPKSTPAKLLTQTVPFNDDYYKIMKHMIRDHRELDFTELRLHAESYQRNVTLPTTLTTGNELTTVDYVQYTVSKWASYQASQDIDASGNKLNQVSQVTLSNNTDLKAWSQSGIQIDAQAVRINGGLLLLDDKWSPSPTGVFNLVHPSKSSGIQFTVDGNIKFQTGHYDSALQMYMPNVFQPTIEPLELTTLTGSILTTVDYVQGTVANWSNYVALHDIDANGNMVKNVQEIDFTNSTEIKAVAPNTLEIDASCVNISGSVLSLDGPSNKFEIKHPSRCSGITFQPDGSIAFQAGIWNNATSSFEAAPNVPKIDSSGRLCCSIITPTIEVVPSLSNGEILFFMSDPENEMPSFYALPAVLVTDVSGGACTLINGQYYVKHVGFNSPLPDSYSYTFLFQNKSSDTSVFFDSTLLINTSNLYLTDFQGTLQIAPGSSAMITMFKGGSPNVVICVKQLTDTAQSVPLIVNCCGGGCDDEENGSEDGDEDDLVPV